MFKLFEVNGKTVDAPWSGDKSSAPCSSFYLSLPISFTYFPILLSPSSSKEITVIIMCLYMSYYQMTLNRQPMDQSLFSK